DEAGHLKVTDFGLNRYMAPEVYRRESYGKSVDVLSFALIVHEMFLGGPSNREEAPEQVADKTAYEDYRPHLASYIFPEQIKIFRSSIVRHCSSKCELGSAAQKMVCMVERFIFGVSSQDSFGVYADKARKEKM
ncbi:hypothetical protein HAX54_022519, partial [Datura stramonium]|nr:hypothetical protein [Datura stramonium]